MSTDNEKLDALGQFLITYVRDQRFERLDKILTGERKLSNEKMQRLLERFPFCPEQLEVVEYICRYAIDATIHHTLWGLEQQEGKISLQIMSGGAPARDAVEISDGLPGELYSEDGWIARFSNYDEVI